MDEVGKWITWYSARSSSTLEGWREPSPLASVPAPQALPPRASSLLNRACPIPYLQQPQDTNFDVCKAIAVPL